jgi:hypothetical protein
MEWRHLVFDLRPRPLWSLYHDFIFAQLLGLLRAPGHATQACHSANFFLLAAHRLHFSWATPVFVSAPPTVYSVRRPRPHHLDSPPWTFGLPRQWTRLSLVPSSVLQFARWCAAWFSRAPWFRVLQFLLMLCVDCCRNLFWLCSWATKLKSLRVFSFNRF